MTGTPTILDLDGYTDLPPGKIAAIVTLLELRERPAPLAEPADAGLSMRRVERPQTGWYRDLFRRIGQDFLWFSRLRLTESALRAILDDPAVEVYALERDGAAIGMIELDFRAAPEEVELSFLGLVPGTTGNGAGRFLMNRANEIVWARAPKRFFVHTCSLDHPAAIPFYRKAGFTAYAMSVEVTDDPRLTGDLPADAAPQVPVLRPGMAADATD